VVRRGAHSTILAGWCGVAATHHAVPHDTVVFHVLPREVRRAYHI
jgi:hypothetical protein